jgi:hypothetical protein
LAPSPSDYGSIKVGDSDVHYVSSSHWAAVLDSIPELRDHIDQDVKLREMISYNPSSQLFPSPQLFYQYSPGELYNGMWIMNHADDI